MIDYAIHAHCYQPPREDPFTGAILPERDAEPYANWNERITAESYGPNAAAGNFDRLSFNLGGTLARWLAVHRTDVYARIVDADRRALLADGVGNAIAQPVHHTILPLARRRDRRLQIRWGVASFEHRFGRPPRGAWLPECAVDLETLECLHEAGLRFTIVSEEQLVDGPPARNHAGPYRVRLGRGRSMAVYVRDRLLSNQVAFDLPHILNRGDASEWFRGELARRAGVRAGGRGARLVLIASDGETFGHHHRGGVEFLADLLAAGDGEGAGAGDGAVRRVTLTAHLRDHPPRSEVRLREYSAWSCGHDLARWVTGCECTPGDSRWKGALRRALDNLAAELDGLYQGEAQAAGAEPWALAEDYIAVELGQLDGPRFLQARGLGGLRTGRAGRLLQLLRAGFHRQRMFTSCAFFFEDLTRGEPRLAVANAAFAIHLVQQATGVDLGPAFRSDLVHAVSVRTGIHGSELYEAVRLEGLERLASGR